LNLNLVLNSMCINQIYQYTFVKRLFWELILFPMAMHCKHCRLHLHLRLGRHSDTRGPLHRCMLILREKTVEPASEGPVKGPVLRVSLVTFLAVSMPAIMPCLARGSLTAGALGKANHALSLSAVGGAQPRDTSLDRLERQHFNFAPLGAGTEKGRW
jgi:hypothetical protein